MLVTIDGKQIAVKFQHTQIEEIKGTKCLIVEGKESSDPDKFIGTGIATLHPKDAFCKEKGRRVALRKALSDAGYNKSQRTVFWQEYQHWGVNPRW